MKFRLDKHVYRRSDGLSHGPERFPWWHLVTVKLCLCSHDPDCLFWDVPRSYNIWFYTRWGARCLNVTVREGTYKARDLWDAEMERARGKLECDINGDR